MPWNSCESLRQSHGVPMNERRLQEGRWCRALWKLMFSFWAREVTYVRMFNNLVVFQSYERKLPYFYLGKTWNALDNKPSSIKTNLFQQDVLSVYKFTQEAGTCLQRKRCVTFFCETTPLPLMMQHPFPAVTEEDDEIAIQSFVFDIAFAHELVIMFWCQDMTIKSDDHLLEN